MDYKSQMGYRYDSPFRNDPFIDIFSPEGKIDMSKTKKDLMGIDEFGNIQHMKGGRKQMYSFKGQQIREIPLDQFVKGGLTSSKAKEMLMDGTANKKKLTKKQKRYFQAIAHGWKPDMQQGGSTNELLSYLFEEDEAPVQQEQQPQQQDSEDIDLRELELNRREEAFQEEQDYNESLMQAMFAGENPFNLERGEKGSFSISGPKFSKENVDDKAKQSYQYFISKGYTPEVSAGLVANIKHESNFNPFAVGDAGKAKGLAQWHPDRYNRLNQEYDLTSLAGNLEAIHNELQTTERGAFQKIKNARTPEEAALLVDRYFERSAGYSTGPRMNTAKNVYNSLNQ